MKLVVLLLVCLRCVAMDTMDEPGLDWLTHEQKILLFDHVSMKDSSKMGVADAALKKELRESVGRLLARLCRYGVGADTKMRVGVVDRPQEDDSDSTEVSSSKATRTMLIEMFLEDETYSFKCGYNVPADWSREKKLLIERLGCLKTHCSKAALLAVMHRTKSSPDYVSNNSDVVLAHEDFVILREILTAFPKQS